MLPRNLTLLVITLVALLVIGTFGYEAIEESYSLFDSFYMTVVTLTTVGYGEVHPLSPEGRVFTIVLQLVGVFTLFWAAGEIIRVIVGGEVQTLLGRRRMERNLSALNDHFIVCGYGRMGRHVCHEFSEHERPYVLVDLDPKVIDEFDKPHGIPLQGDATSDDVLIKAGIERARGLVAVAASDTDNLVITLSARMLNEGLYIVARAEQEPTQEKLTKAGANRVIAPYLLGGARIADAVLRPHVVAFIDSATRSENVELRMEEVRVRAGSSLIDASISDTLLHKKHGISIIAIQKPSGATVANPAGDMQLELDDVLIVLGHPEELAYLAKVARDELRGAAPSSR